MSGSYLSDYEIIEQLSQLEIGGHVPDEETQDIMKDVKADHRQNVANFLEAWAKAFRGE